MPTQVMSEPKQAKAGTKSISTLVVSSVALAMLLSAALSGFRFNFTYFDLDTISYFFQAKLFAQGRLAADAPPDLGFSPSTHINVGQSHWYSKYPFGNSLALSLGVLVGAPWLIPVLATGGALLLLYGILLETYGRKVARVGIVLGVISPPTIVLGSVWFSEAVSRFCVGLFLYLLILAFKKQDWKRAAFAGMALGYAFDTRPLTAVTIGSVAGLLFVLYSWAATSWTQRARLLCATGLGFAVIGGLTVAWNFEMTGDPLQATFNAMQPYDRLGFGPRGNQYPLDPPPPVYPPQAAVRRIARSLPAMLQSGLGVGYYDFRLYEALRAGSTVARLKMLGEMAGFLVPLLLIGLSIRSREHRIYSVLFASISAACLVAYAFYFFDGATWGFTPFHTRYQTEAIMFGFLPLVARGFVTLRERISFASTSRKVALAFAMGLIALNYAHYWTRIFPRLQPRGLEKMEEALLQIHSDHAVVFYANALDVPVGDYPFTSLEKARIVTYRLTNDRMWGLEGNNPEELYARYFQGRDAYLFRDDKLVKLDLPVATREKL